MVCVLNEVYKTKTWNEHGGEEAKETFPAEERRRSLIAGTMSIRLSDNISHGMCVDKFDMTFAPIGAIDAPGYMGVSSALAKGARKVIIADLLKHRCPRLGCELVSSASVKTRNGLSMRTFQVAITSDKCGHANINRYRNLKIIASFRQEQFYYNLKLGH